MFNTPPVVPVFAALQTLKWLKNNGGISEMHKKNIPDFSPPLLYHRIFP